VEHEEQVAKLFDELAAQKQYHDEISYLMGELDVTRDDAIAAWLFYDLAIRDYSNEAYKSSALRLVMHLHNFLVGNWHDIRQATILKYLAGRSPASICEIGFGTPQRYVSELAGTTRIMLCDYETASLDFARQVLSFRHDDGLDRVTLQRHDMNKDALPADFNAYLFQDSIEHAIEPTETLQSYVESTAVGTDFVFSLPIEIGEPIPGHFISWPAEDKALTWLESTGLTVLDSTVINFNRGLDLHSHRLHPVSRQIAVLTTKMT
jgi:hypothetical protein